MLSSQVEGWNTAREEGNWFGAHRLLLIDFIMFLNFNSPTLIKMDLWRSGLLLGSRCPPVP